MVVTALRAHLIAYSKRRTSLQHLKDKQILISQVAAETGQTEEEILARWRGQNDASQQRRVTEAERQADMDELLAFAGSLRGDDPLSSDNDRIDADLAREYGATHEDEA